MPRSYREPATCVTTRGSWPGGPFAKNTPAYALVTAEFVRAVNTASDSLGWSNRKLAREAGIDPGALSRLLSGQSVPDLGTVVALEDALGARLYPTRHQPATDGV